MISTEKLCWGTSTLIKSKINEINKRKKKGLVSAIMDVITSAILNFDHLFKLCGYIFYNLNKNAFIV